MPGYSQVDAPQNLRSIAGGGQTLTVDATAGGVQLAVLPSGTQYVLLHVRTAAITMTCDGTAPVAATTGRTYGVGTEILLCLADAKNAKFIRDTGTNGAIWAEALTY